MNENVSLKICDFGLSKPLFETGNKRNDHGDKQPEPKLSAKSIAPSYSQEQRNRDPNRLDMTKFAVYMV